jgi:hypothetical protein
MAEKHSIITQKTARVFTYGQLTEKTKLVWIVTHGYGFLAEFFIKKFEELNPDENFVIVPEALNRFYLKEYEWQSWCILDDNRRQRKRDK